MIKEEMSESNEKEKEEEEYIGIWEYIPKNAFLYFPKGQQIKIGDGQKQWRKIFQNNEPYEEFEENALLKLEEKLLISQIEVHQWFTKANKLRYLQANKWKKTPTCEAIAQYSRYRQKQFPIKETPGILSLLRKGTFYFCGRDLYFRPIIVVDLDKFQESDIDLIPSTLVFMMEFMIKNLLIEGQIENYCLIMNLQKFSMSQKSLVTKIIGFTSNSYRGRLFVSYLLGAPGMLRFGWNSIASAFVSENTLRKIKVTGDMQFKQMWDHVSPSIIEKRFGGEKENQTQGYWPVEPEIFLSQEFSPDIELIEPKQYNQMFQNAKLENRKVLKSYLRRKSVAERDKTLQHKSFVHDDPEIESKKILDKIDRTSLTDVTILVESSVLPEIKSIRTFFNNSSYLKIR